MKALTIWQPWAQAIADGYKPVENRTWRPRGVQVGEDIAIHAGLRFEDDAVEDIEELTGVRYDTRTAPGGVIVAVARLARVTKSGDGSPWFSGPVGWWFEDVRRVSPPIPCRGGRGLWDVPLEVLHRLERLQSGEWGS